MSKIRVSPKGAFLMLCRILFSTIILVTGILAEQLPNEQTIVLSGTATTARIADPAEQVVVNGQVMKMSDFVAAVSSSTAAVQRLHTQETHTRGSDSQAAPSVQKYSTSPCSVAAEGT